MGPGAACEEALVGISLIHGGGVGEESIEGLESPRLKRDFHEFSLVGKGGFGRVLRARHRLDGEVYAIKVIQFNVDVRHLESRTRRFLREVQCLRRLNPNPFIVRYFSSWLETRAVSHAAPGQGGGGPRTRLGAHTQAGGGGPLPAGFLAVAANGEQWGLQPSSEPLEGAPLDAAGEGPLACPSTRAVPCSAAAAAAAAAPWESLSGADVSTDLYWCVESCSGDNTEGLKISFRHPSGTPVLDSAGEGPREDRGAPLRGRLSEEEEAPRDDLGVPPLSARGEERTAVSPVASKEAFCVCQPLGAPTASTIKVGGPSRPLRALGSSKHEEAPGNGGPTPYGCCRMQGTVPQQQQNVGGRVEVSLYIQMEFCPMSLEQYIANTPEVDGPRAAHFLSQIVTGLAFCHSRGVIHRDLKPSNLFLTQEETVRIGDFGLALREDLGAPSLLSGGPPPPCEPAKERHQQQQLTGAATTATDFAAAAAADCSKHLSPARDGPGPCAHAGEPPPPAAAAAAAAAAGNRTRGVGTTVYAPPEQLEGRVYGSGVDIWALGLVALDLFTRSETVMERSEVLQRARQGIAPPVLDEMYPEVAAFCRSCLQIDPLRRPTTKELYQLVLEQGCLFRGPFARPPWGLTPQSPLMGTEAGDVSSPNLQQQQAAYLLCLGSRGKGDTYLVPPSPYLLCTPKLLSPTAPLAPYPSTSGLLKEAPGGPLPGSPGDPEGPPRGPSCGAHWGAGAEEEETAAGAGACFLPACVDVRSRKKGWKRRFVTLDLLRWRLYVYGEPWETKPRKVYELGGPEGFTAAELHMPPPPTTPTTAAEASPGGGEAAHSSQGDSLPVLSFLETEGDWGVLPPPLAGLTKTAEPQFHGSNAARELREEGLIQVSRHRSFIPLPPGTSQEILGLSHGSSSEETTRPHAASALVAAAAATASGSGRGAISPSLAVSHHQESVHPGLLSPLKALGPVPQLETSLGLLSGDPGNASEAGAASWVLVLTASRLREDLWIRGCASAGGETVAAVPSSVSKQQLAFPLCSNRAWLEGLLGIMRQVQQQQLLQQLQQ